MPSYHDGMRGRHVSCSIKRTPFQPIQHDRHKWTQTSPRRHSQQCRKRCSQPKFTTPAQVAFTLAVAEEAVEYEHRDMHWGNVLVRPAESTVSNYTLRGVPIRVQTHGTSVSLIDFTASR